VEPLRSRVDALRAIPLFRTLEDRDLSEIAQLLIERKFPKAATIFEEGVSGEYMYLIQEGQVKVTKISDDGRQKILEILAPGDFFGEMALLDREPRSASIKTTSPCILLALSRRDFLRLFRRNPDLAMELIRVLSRRIRDADEQIRALLFERVESRTRRVLTRLARENPAQVPGYCVTAPITHQELADMVGTSRETVTRILKELRDEGWLQKEGKRYVVKTEES
jgi:CRP-like cAMP-binding protein